MKIKSKSISVAVVGAGLAGLSTAYELAKAGVAVTVFEAGPQVGGRVKSVEINGHKIDLGGFIIYPWYTEYHRLIKELDLQKKLHKIGKVNIVYALSGQDAHTNKPKFDLSEKFKLGAGLVKAWKEARPNFRAPDLQTFAGQTIADFLQSKGIVRGKLAEFLDTINQGYCYAGLSDFEMSFYAPFVFQTLAKGDLRTGTYFGGNNQLFAEALAKKIIKMGGDIRLKSPVTKVGKNALYVKGKKMKFNAIVLATPVNTLYKPIISEPIFPYTCFYAAVMKMKQPLTLPKHTSWSAVFVSPKARGACITSVIQASQMVKKLSDQYLIINYKVTSTKSSPKILEKQLLTELERIFPGSGEGKLILAHPWHATMPVASTAFVTKVRAKQGKNNFYFAGDYLGAPSMETAVSSGVQVAGLIKQELL